MPRGLTLALALALAAGAARAAEPPLGPSLAEMIYARSAALGAYLGVVPGADAIVFNPAALAARKAFTAELQYYTDRLGSDMQAQFYGLAVVDSTTGPVAGGASVTRAQTLGYQGWVNDVALAVPIFGGFYLGGTIEYLTFSGPVPVNAVTATASAFLEIGQVVTIGATAYNFINIYHADLVPRGFGAGVAVGSDRLFHLSADWRGLRGSDDVVKNSFAAGFEVLLFDLIPLRGGYLFDDWRQGQWWSAGTGIVTPWGVALDLTYRQAIGYTSARTFAGTLKFFFGSL